MLPALSPLWKFFGLEIFPEKPMDFFADIVRQILELRKDGTTSEVRGGEQFDNINFVNSYRVSQKKQNAVKLKAR